MNYYIISEILKYLDCFGTTFSFYTEKNRKFYTILGGILSLLSFIFGFLVFIFINKDDIFHNNPSSTTSTKRENIRKIKFGEEKIWIPWRITNYESETVNHEDILFPIIYYYKGIRNDSSNHLQMSYEIINYKLCNETSMANNSNQYMIDVDLGQIYCIDMDDLEIGGSWDSDFIYYIEFDLYNCKDGLNYDEGNENCTTYEEIREIAGNDNCFDFEMYYPIVHYQPMNKTTPIFVEYVGYFYHLSRFSNKIDRIYLQQHILKDDRGWITKNEKLYSYWGGVSLNGDSYATGNGSDLMSEGSTSRFYSFNIYLKSDIIYYNRTYKNFFLIIANGLPIVNIVFIIFKVTAKIFKISSGNKKLTELLFENLQKKKIMRFKDEKFSILDLDKMNSDKELVKLNNNKNISDLSSVQITYNESKNAMFHNSKSIRLNEVNNNNKIAIFRNSNKQMLNINNRKKINKNLNNNLNEIYNNNLEKNRTFKGNNLEDLFSIKSNEIASNKQFNKINMKKNNSEGNEKRLNSQSKAFYVKRTLFPYKYYLCTIFIKNLDTTKKSIFFTRKFLSVYNFICQLFDISSYLILQREFEIMKNSLIVGKYKDILENRQKINVNDQSFNINMKECLDAKKFSILGRVKPFKFKNQQIYK